MAVGAPVLRGLRLLRGLALRLEYPLLVGAQSAEEFRRLL
jgi:hypothetical protein